jgi:hypothetical protein
MSVFLFGAGADAEKKVQRAKATNGCVQQYGCKAPGHNAPAPSQDIQAGQSKEDDGQQNADDPVGNSYILFHTYWFKKCCFKKLRISSIRAGSSRVPGYVLRISGTG